MSPCVAQQALRQQMHAALIPAAREANTARCSCRLTICRRPLSCPNASLSMFRPQRHVMMSVTQWLPLYGGDLATGCFPSTTRTNAPTWVAACLPRDGWRHLRCSGARRAHLRCPSSLLFRCAKSMCVITAADEPAGFVTLRTPTHTETRAHPSVEVGFPHTGEHSHSVLPTLLV